MFVRHLIIIAIAFAFWMVFKYAPLFSYRLGFEELYHFLSYWNTAIIGLFSFLLFTFLPPTFRKWYYVLSYILTMPVLLTIYRLGGGLVSYKAPPNEIALATSSILGYSFTQSKLPVFRYIYPGLMVVICAFYYVSIEPLWRHFSIYGTFTPTVSKEIPDGWYVYNEKREMFNKHDWKDKTVVMEMWNKDCGPCVYSLPKWQKFYDQHKGENMLIEAVHVPFFNRELPADSGFYYARKKGYSFPVVAGTVEVLNAFDVYVIPTVIVLKNDRIVFRGTIDELQEFIASNPGFNQGQL